MSAITRASLDSNRLTIVFIATVIVLGLIQFFDFPRQEDPPITIREVVVTAFFPGMPPVEMEELVTRRLEAELRSLPELADIWSDSKQGVTIIHAETRDEFDDLDLIWQKVRNRMLDVRPQLPEGTIGPFVNDEFGLTAVATIALWSDGFSMADMRVAARDVRDRLYELPGTRKVELHGVHDEAVFLEFSTARLAQFDLSAAHILNTLIEQNVVLPGGRVDNGAQQVIVSPSGNFNSIDDIENVEIPIPNSAQTVRLHNLVTVTKGYADPARNKAYYNGKRAIVLSVAITPGVNSVAYGEALKSKISALESELPIGYVLDFATFQPDLVEAAVNGGLGNVYETIIIVLIVVMAFLGVRTGLIVGSFVPLTMLTGLIIMRLMGLELERVSIASSIIALGMLVDNGIVIAEDIRSRLERGEDRREACLETGRSLSIPLLTSSMTTILAFLPMLLLLGQTGEYAKSLPMVVTILLLASWFLSMYVTPSMCYWFMKVPEKGEPAVDPYGAGFYKVYRALLQSLLAVRGVVFVGAIAAIFAGGFIATLLVREFFGPSTDRAQFLVYVDLPAGQNIESADDTVRQVADYLADAQQNPEVTGTVAYVGFGGPRFFLVLSPVQPNPHVGFLVVDTSNAEDVPTVIKRLREKFEVDFPGANGRVKQMWMGSSEPGFVEVRLVGPNPEVLYEKGNLLVDALRRIPGALDVRHNWENKVARADILVDQVRARRAGVTSRDVARGLQSQMDGLNITQYREGDVAIPVVVRATERHRGSLGDLWNAKITSSQTGQVVPLTQIASIQVEADFYRVSRHNQERTLTVEFKHEQLLAPQLLEAALPLIDDLQLGSAYRWDVGGEIEQSQQTMGGLMQWMPICIFGIVVLLIWQFNSFRRPLIIFITIPLAFTGAFIGLLIMGAPFDFFAMLGLLSLAGVIINNGIVLIDKIDTDREDGMEPAAAILNAALSRFRPIFMTTVTTVLGLAPLILSQDPLFYSMAVVLAFGLLFGTVLTLGVVPIIYSVLFRVK
ncbi:MAG: efflux RND transporter permease subunit [Halieaceae bacterium]